MSGRLAIGMDIQELLHDWSITKKFQVMTDDSSRKAFASKRGLDKMKHIQTRYLWIQERRVLKHFVLDKVRTLQNRADVHTKQLSADEVHLRARGRDNTAKFTYQSFVGD